MLSSIVSPPLEMGPAIGDHPVVAISATEMTVVTVIFGLLALASLGFCVTVAVRRRQLWPVFLYIGGGVAVWYETLTDVLGRCVWAPPGDWPSVVDLYGRTLPLFANFTYLFYFPVVQVGVILLLERGLPFRKWLTYIAIAVSGAALFELYPVHRKWWWYFGDGQPVSILGYPVYWAFCAEAAVTGGAAIIYLLRRNGYLPERRSWLMMLLPASLTPMIHMAIVWPAHTAISSSTDLWVTTPAALATIVLACIMIALIGHIATKQSMADKAKRDTVADRPVDHPRSTALAPS